MPITIPLNNASLLVDTALETLNNYNVNYVFEDDVVPLTVASLQLNGCKVLREFTYTNIITGNGIFTFNVPEKIPGIFALQLLKCYVDVQPRLQELTETIRVNGQYPLSAFITELDETDGISKDSVINVDVSGDVPVLESKSITINSNGTQNVLPSSGYDGLSSVSLLVNVPVPKIEIGKSERISTNGIVNITPDSGYDALESVRVNVEVPNGTETKSITSNGTYTPTSPNIGFSSVTVNVPQENLNIETSKMVNISSNGLKNVLPSLGYDALGKVQVNVAVPNETETKTITSNGTYTPTSPNIGFSSVTVNVPELNIEGNKTLATITKNGDSVVTPSTGYDAMQKVTFSVNVEPKLDQLIVTENGNYVPSSEIDGFRYVKVDVPEKQLETRQVYYSTNGVHRLSPSTGYDGFSYADIEVAVPSSKISFDKLVIQYGSGTNPSDYNEQSLTIKDMSVANLSDISVQSGHGCVYFTELDSSYSQYVLGFYNNNSSNTYKISNSGHKYYYKMYTGSFVSSVTTNGNSIPIISYEKLGGNTNILLNYNIYSNLPKTIYEFRDSEL